MDISFKWICLLCYSVGVLFRSVKSAKECNGTNCLSIHILDENKLSATFSIPVEGEEQDSGIRLLASELGFEVKTLLSSRMLLSVQAFGGGQSLVINILNVSLLRYNEEDYIIPQRLYSVAHNVSSIEDVHFLINDLTESSAPTRSSNLVYMTAFNQFSREPESQLILEACEALGDLGISGSSYPYMLPLYLLATRLPRPTVRQPRPTMRRQLRFLKKEPEDQCSNFGVVGGNECLGLCGDGCHCWKFVCGDCCLNLGCYEHDLCCKRHIFNTRCIFPTSFGFSCESYGGYPACISCTLSSLKMDFSIFLLFTLTQLTILRCYSFIQKSS